MKDNQDTALSPAELLLELKVLVTEAETMMAKSLSGHSARDVGTLRERFGAAKERFADVYSGARKNVIAGAKSTDTSIRTNPYQSLAIAGGVGLAIGVLVGVFATRREP